MDRCLPLHAPILAVGGHQCRGTAARRSGARIWPGPAVAAMQASPRRQMSHEEEEQILKRADELTARVEAIIREFDTGR